MAISGRHLRFICIEQGIIPVVFNFFLNGFIAWMVFQSMESVPLWGQTSLGVDLLLTAFLLPFLTTVISSVIIKKQVLSKKVPPLYLYYLNGVGWLRCSPVRFGIIFGLFCVVFCAIPMVWILSLSHLQAISVDSYIIFKSGWAAMLSLLVSPVVGWWALAKVSSDVVA